MAGRSSCALTGGRDEIRVHLLRKRTLGATDGEAWRRGHRETRVHQAGGIRQLYRYGGRMVRLLSLRDGRRPRLQPTVLPNLRAPHGDAGLVRDVRGGVLRASVGRDGIRALRGPRRAEV